MEKQKSNRKTREILLVPNCIRSYAQFLQSGIASWRPSKGCMVNVVFIFSFVRPSFWFSNLKQEVSYLKLAILPDSNEQSLIIYVSKGPTGASIGISFILLQGCRRGLTNRLLVVREKREHV